MKSLLWRSRYIFAYWRVYGLTGHLKSGNLKIAIMASENAYEAWGYLFKPEVAFKIDNTK